MDHLVNLITSFGYFSYAILFVVIFFESFPLTFFLPGDSLLFTTGFLASQGYFNLAFLVGILFVASILGYMFSYATGQKIRDFILKSNDKYWFKKRHIDYTQNFYQKYGAKTLIIGRFIPIVRSFAPTLAGAVQMQYKQFIKFVFIGGFLWTVGITLIGFYLGQIMPDVHFYLTPIIISIIFVSFIPAIIEFVRSRMKRKIS
jgi:membrane-associated protein